jgi:thiosulfate/3-mercaptopyruvate sulfurtransferase
MSSCRARLLLCATLALPIGAVAPQGSSSLLITPAELSRIIRDPSLVLLHVGPRDDYAAGHIAGAQFIQMQDLALPNAPGTPALTLPDEADLRARLEKLGIGDNSRIVVVAGKDWVSPSTRIVWTLQAAGLGARTQWLDGGSDAWKRAGLPLTTDAPPAPVAGRLTITADRSVVVDREWVRARLGTPGFRLIDARAPMFYDGPGMDMNGQRHEAGHIPGAKNLPFNTIANDSLQYLPRATLAKMFADAGVAPGDTVVAYCHIGQQATAVLFAARLAGHPVKLYDGSFTEWEEQKLPIERSTPARGAPSRQ